MFHIIFESSPEAIALTRVRDGAIVQVNREWESMTGYQREEVVGRTALALGHWLHPEQRTSIFGDLKPGGRVMDVDVSLVMKDASPRVVRLNATMLMEAGEAYILIYLRDVTADLLAREALRSGELALAHANTAMNRQVKLHELTESVAQVGHWVNYPGDKTVYLSPGLAQIAGLEQEAVVTMDMLWGRVFPEDLPALHQARHRMDGEVVEFRSSGPGGRTLWARSRMHRQVVDGRVLADFGVVQEFTQEREARDSLQKQFDFIHKITSRAPGMLFEFQRLPNGRFSFPFVSDAVRQFFGVTAEQAQLDSRRVMSRMRRAMWSSDSSFKAVRSARSKRAMRS